MSGCRFVITSSLCSVLGRVAFIKVDVDHHGTLKRLIKGGLERRFWRTVGSTKEVSEAYGPGLTT